MVVRADFALVFGSCAAAAAAAEWQFNFSMSTTDSGWQHRNDTKAQCIDSFIWVRHDSPTRLSYVSMSFA